MKRAALYSIIGAGVASAQTTSMFLYNFDQFPMEASVQGKAGDVTTYVIACENSQEGACGLIEPMTVTYGSTTEKFVYTAGTQFTMSADCSFQLGKTGVCTASVGGTGNGAPENTQVAMTLGPDDLQLRTVNVVTKLANQNGPVADDVVSDLAGAGSAIATAVGGVVSGAEGAYSKAKTWGEAVGSAIVTGAEGAYSKAKTAAEGAYSEAKTLGGEVASRVATGAEGAYSKAKSEAGALGTAVQSDASAAGSAIKSDVSAAGSAAATAAAGVTSAAGSAAGSGSATSAPSTSSKSSGASSVSHGLATMQIVTVALATSLSLCMFM